MGGFASVCVEIKGPITDLLRKRHHIYHNFDIARFGPSFRSGRVDCVVEGLWRLSHFIIQQIVTMPKYGKEALNICHPYMTDILRYT